MLELHCAHGYLLSGFITPLSQPAHGRVRRQPREPPALSRWRSSARCATVWPQERPMSVRISATDWVEGGIEGSHAVEVGAGVPSGRRGHHPRFGRADGGGRQAGLRPHVPDAVLGPHPQRDGHPHDRRRQHHRARPGELDHRRRPRRPLRPGAPPSRRSQLDPARRRRSSATPRSPGRCSTSPASSSSSGTSSGSGRRSCWGRARFEGMPTNPRLDDRRPPLTPGPSPGEGGAAVRLARALPLQEQRR